MRPFSAPAGTLPIAMGKGLRRDVAGGFAGATSPSLRASLSVHGEGLDGEMPVVGDEVVGRRGVSPDDGCTVRGFARRVDGALGGRS